MKFRIWLVALINATLILSAHARGSDENGDSLGSKLKRFFTGPAPTPSPSPTPRKKRAASEDAASDSPAESLSPTPSASPTAPAASISPTAVPEETASPIVAVPAPAASTAPVMATTPPAKFAQNFEPVRPITPSPHHRPRPQPSAAPQEAATSAPDKTPAPSATTAPSATASPSPKKDSSSIANLSAAEITGYEESPAEVKKLLDLALGLTNQNLAYKYNSADPANGGMDCSGFIYYVLSKNGIKDVPRDAREQYIWARKAGTFQSVLDQRDDSFELERLKPGDLLFWAGPYSPKGEPEITSTMIYLGREKGTKRRVMVGANEGHTYKGKPRSGVGVFDFSVGRARPKKDGESGPTFVGYASIPGLRAD